MVFEAPTYEEYKRASEFARFRYKYGLFVTGACLICFILLMYYIVRYGEELAQDPMTYAMKQKPNLECHCYDKILTRENSSNEFYTPSRIDFYINSTNKWVEFSSRGGDLPTQEELDKMLKNLLDK